MARRAGQSKSKNSAVKAAAEGSFALERRGKRCELGCSGGATSTVARAAALRGTRMRSVDLLRAFTCHAGDRQKGNKGNGEPATVQRAAQDSLTGSRRFIHSQEASLEPDSLLAGLHHVRASIDCPGRARACRRTVRPRHPRHPLHPLHPLHRALEDVLVDPRETALPCGVPACPGLAWP